MPVFKSLSEYSAPFVAFLFSLGLAFGVYALLPLLLPHQGAFSPQDRLTVTSEYPLF
jgi:hypothetical protein